MKPTFLDLFSYENSYNSTNQIGAFGDFNFSMTEEFYKFFNC